MEGFDAYDRHDAVGLAELVRRREVHPRDLVLAAISRIEALDSTINAVVSRRFERALVEAEDVVLDGAPFAGVPILLKDLLVEEGEPVTFGSVFFRDHRGEVTGEFARRIRRAGFLRLGRTNTPEFGLLPTTEPILHGPTRNPWNLDHSPGGSSGGAAAAVAAGYLPLAQASDGGGSIRIPASCCGLVGFKPSRGLLPRSLASPADHLSVELAVSRTVRDTAAFFDAVA
ncbi:MAG TPA: amidase, partial [Actinobacteria bacterium]|nr:amidase [Actinomycetota bacterium]